MVADNILFHSLFFFFFFFFFFIDHGRDDNIFLTNQIIGTHEGGVKCMVYVQDQDLLVSGSWDKTVRGWDPRVSSGADHTKSVAKILMPGKVFSMDAHGHRLVVAIAQRKIHIYDTRKLDPRHAEIETETLLKYQTRCVRCFPNGLGYAVASVEGRVSIEYFSQEQEQQSKKYAFKCHRKVENGTEYVYPVNAIAFHPLHGTFATGGCDGRVMTWDGIGKKRLYQYSQYQVSTLSHTHTLFLISLLLLLLLLMLSLSDCFFFLLLRRVLPLCPSIVKALSSPWPRLTPLNRARKITRWMRSTSVV